MRRRRRGSCRRRSRFSLNLLTFDVKTSITTQFRYARRRACFTCPAPKARGFLWCAMKKVAIIMDGGYTRVLVRKAGKVYNPDYIEKLARAAVISPEVSAYNFEEILRVLYYDCPPFNGRVKLPVSGQYKELNDSGTWLDDLAQRDLFAVRRGVLKFRGFVPKAIPVAPATLRDEDFKMSFEQKGVDMRIGLDIATYANNRSVDRFVVFTADTDCIPAFKHARKSGLQVVLVDLPNGNLIGELRQHVDFVRSIELP